MDDPDPSWYLGSYDETIREAYQILTGPPLNLEELSPPPFSKALEGKIYHLLHDVLCEFPECFAGIVLEIIPPSQARSIGGSLVRVAPPAATCLAILQEELEDLRAARDRATEEEENWHARVLDAGHTDESFWLPASSAGQGDEDVEMAHDSEEEEEDQVEERQASGANKPAPPTFPTYLAHLSPTKRLSEQPIQDTSKRHRTSSSVSPTPITHAFQQFTPRPFARTTSTVSTSSTSTFSRTTSSSTTTSIATTTITTPARSFFALSRNNSKDSEEIRSESKWEPRKALPADERRILCTPINPLQAQSRRFGIRFEVQWEMERILAKQEALSWRDIKLNHITQFMGNAEDVLPRLGGILRQIAAEKVDSQSAIPTLASNPRRIRLWREMDKEEEIIRSDKTSTKCEGKIAYTIIVRPCGIRQTNKVILGDMVPPPELPPTQVAPPDRRENSLRFTMTLCEPDMPGKSFRLARRFGSRRIISFKLMDFKYGTTRDAMNLFVGRILEVCGVPFRAVWAPHDRDSVFAIEVGNPDPTSTLMSTMPSFPKLFAMYNDPSQKPSQAMAKWAARPQILFSDSEAATFINPSAILIVPDIVSTCASSYQEATTEQILTDGCGLMSESLARRLRRDPNDTRPCVVQIRLGGSKGLLTLMSPSQHEQYPGKEVVLRDSMVKALSAQRYSSDPSLLTVDVVRYGYLRISTTLSSETIVGMHHNGVPAKTFIDMTTEGLDELKDAFAPTAQEGESREDVLCRLVTSCYRFGGIGTERKKRACAEEGVSLRAMGLSDRRDVEEDTKDDGPGELIHESEQYGIDPVSGQPGSIAEALMMALMAGFDPLESHYTSAKLHHLVSALSDTMIRKFRIPIDRSMSAFIIPDAQQVLQPNEVFISFSTNCPLDLEMGSPITQLLGPVLVLRAPCKLPTDIRKFTAVYKPELAHLKDCIVMSANAELCNRSPASFLGGGDYDGDTAQIFWDPALIEPFQNAHEDFANPTPDFVENNFERDVVKVEEFHAALQAVGADEETVIANQQHFLLGALQGDRSTANYSDLHGNAVYKLGYDHPETIRLAHMFCHVLDARKSGLTVRPRVKRIDETKYGGQVAWRAWKKNDEKKNTIVEKVEVVRNSRKLGPFILDDLMAAGQTHRRGMMAFFPEQPVVSSHADHNELSALWFRIKDRPHVQGQVQLVLHHVTACFQIWSGIRVPGRRIDGPIVEVYRTIKAGGTTNLSPRKVYNGQMTPSKGKRRGDAVELSRLTQMRQLAEVWRDELTPLDVPDLSMYGDADILRRIKVSCGATLNPYKPKQTFVFDMDFATTCAIKASSRGEVASVLTGVAKCLKPSWRGRSGVEV